MANTLVQFRAEETVRIKAVNICEKLGIDLPTYLRMCMSRLIQENGVPFSCLLYTSPSPRDIVGSRMPSSA